MTNLRKAAQQALEALNGVLDTYGEPLDLLSISGGTYEALECRNAITALREALAKPEQPHDLSCLCGAEWNIYADGREELVEPPTKKSWIGLTVEEIFDCAHGITRIQQDEWVATDDDLCEFADTAAQVLKKKNGYGTWNRPLSKEQIDNICKSFRLGYTDEDLVRAIERAHGITGERNV